MTKSSERLLEAALQPVGRTWELPAVTSEKLSQSTDSEIGVCWSSKEIGFAVKCVSWMGRGG